MKNYVNLALKKEKKAVSFEKVCERIEKIALKDDPSYLDYFKDVHSRGLNEEELVKDILSQQKMWGEDLNKIANMTEVVSHYLKDINEKGMKEALKAFEGK